MSPLSPPADHSMASGLLIWVDFFIVLDKSNVNAYFVSSPKWRLYTIVHKVVWRTTVIMCCSIISTYVLKIKPIKYSFWQRFENKTDFLYYCAALLSSYQPKLQTSSTHILTFFTCTWIFWTEELFEFSWLKQSLIAEGVFWRDSTFGKWQENSVLVIQQWEHISVMCQ